MTTSTAVESGFMLRQLVEGRSLLQITASLPSVPYHVAVQAPDQAGQPITVRRSGRTAEPGAVDRYEIVYSRGATPPVTIAEVSEPWRFSVLLSSPGDAPNTPILTDPQGRQTGLAKVFPDSAPGTRTTILDVRQPTDGSYMLEVKSPSPGTYTLALTGWDRAGTAVARPELRDVPTSPGVVHSYRIDYASAAVTPVTLHRRFEQGRLLAYANVPSGDIRLKAGVTSFPLAIFYAAGINPVTFNALLNGDNISGRFTPEPEGYQIVQIPLAPGVNTLMLSVDGATAGGQAATDTHRLVFRVE